jgi:hypothetical protein
MSIFSRKSHHSYRKNFRFTKRDYEEMRKTHLLFSSQGLKVRMQYRVIKIIMALCIPAFMLLVLWNTTATLVLAITAMICIGLFLWDYSERHQLKRQLVFIPAISISIGLVFGYLLIGPAVKITMHLFGGIY